VGGAADVGGKGRGLGKGLKNQFLKDLDLSRLAVNGDDE